MAKPTDFFKKKKIERESTGMESVKDLLGTFDWDEKKYISQEFQDFGYRLAEDLRDLEHKSLYIKLAKQLPRPILETARNFVKDARNVNNPGRLFMWKLKELKKEKTAKAEQEKTEMKREE
jgi:hypothetical protein